MKNETFKFIEHFLNKDGMSGYEDQIAEAYKKSVKANGAKVSRDGFGSVIAHVGTKGPKIMIASHMDEVGFVVQQIEKSGVLRISQLGRQWAHTLLATKVKVINTAGKEFIGVIGSTSVHVLQPEVAQKVMNLTDIYVDLGFNSDEEVRKAGIDVGDRVLRETKAELLADGDKFMAKAVDNRIGVAIAAKVIEKLKGIKHPNQLFAVATAQEEVGLRGGQASTQMIQPDIAFAIDTTVSHDTPGVIPGDTKLGHGVAITMKDNSAIANPMLANMLFDLANAKKIPAYKFVSQGGINDSGVTQYSQNGIPVVSISIPTRYLHTPFEVGSIKDFNAVVDLMVEFIKMFDDKKLKSCLYK